MKCLKGKTKSPIVIFTYKNGTEWARISSDGWCEQGGYARATTGSTSVVTSRVNFLSPYVDTNYTVIGSKDTGDGDTVGLNCPVSKNQSSFTWSVAYRGSTLDRGIHWQAKGYVNLEDPTVKKFIDDNK